MAKPEQPKVHCIVLSKLPHNLVKGETEWKLCKIFSTLTKSNQRIHKEKNATRKYKPILAFTVSIPLDADRQTLNFNRGVVKDRLGFAVNCETVAALVDGVGDKGTQWVLTTNEFLKHISLQENLTVDSFYENEFDESKLERLLPSLFKLHSASNRTELVLAAPLIKHPITEDKSMQLDVTYKEPCVHGNKTKREKKNQNVNPDVTLPKSDSDLNGNHPVHVNSGKPDAQRVDIKIQESSSDYEQEIYPSDDLKRIRSANEKHDGMPMITLKIKEEPPEYDYKPNPQIKLADENPVATLPKSIVKVKMELSEYNLDSDCDIVVENPTGAPPPKVIAKVKKEVSEPDKGVKRKDKSKKSQAERHDESAPETNSERGENVPESDCLTEPRKHYGDGGIVKNICPKVKEVQMCGHVTKYLNEKLPVTVNHLGSTLNTIPKVTQSDLVNNHNAKPNSDLKKKQVDNNRGSLEKEKQQSEQSRRPPVSLAVKTSHSRSKEKRRTFSHQNASSPIKQRRPSTERDSTFHKRPNKLPSTEKNSNDQSNDMVEIPKKSGTGICVNASQLDVVDSGSESNSGHNKTHSKLPAVPDLPSSKVSKNKLPSDYMSTLKVVVPKLNIDVPKLKYFNLSEDSMGRHDGVRTENARNTAPQSAEDQISDRAKSSHPPMKRHTHDSVTKQCGDIKRTKSTGEMTDSLLKQLPSAGRQGNPIPAMSRSLSVGSESGKIAKGFVQKRPQEDKIRDRKSPSRPKQAKRDDTSTKGILKTSTSVDCKSNREGHTSATKKRISFGEYKMASKDSTIPQRTKSSSIPESDPQSTELDLLGSLNTNESYLFHTESENEQYAIFNVNGALHSGVNSESAPNKAQTSNSNATSNVPTEIMSKDRSLSYQKRSAVPSYKDSYCGDFKRQRTENEDAGKLPEINLYGPVNDESNGEKGTKKERIRESCVEAGRQNGQPNTSTEIQQNEYRRVHQKSSMKARSNVTLLVGDSMLQHIQPEKFFKKKHVVVKTVPGARVDNVSEYIAKFIQQENPGDVILHIGTNDLHKDTMHISSHIESVGKLISETFPSVAKFAISSIIQRREDVAGARSRKASEVNKALRGVQSEHGWAYINNDNLDPEVHVGPDGIHLNAIGIEAFAVNIGKHLGLVESGSPYENTSSSLSSKDQFAAKITPTETGTSATLCTKSGRESVVSRRARISNARRPITLLAGDSMLESVNVQEDLSNKQVKQVVVPYARVDTFGDMVIDLATHHKVDEVILHVGSNDLNDNTFSPKEIALQIEQIGVDLEKICPSISRITVSGTISRNRQGANEVNTLLKTLQSKHGWWYICHDNVAPTFHNRPFDVKLKDPDADIFKENILRYIQPQDLPSKCSTDLKVPKTQGNGDLCPRQQSSGKVSTTSEESVAFAQNINKHLGQHTYINQPLYPKDQAVAVPEVTFKDEICRSTFISSKTNVAQEKGVLLIGDVMLDSIIPNRLSRKKKIELVVVPDARVDNIGKLVSKHAMNPNVDEVILHVGSNDMKDDVYDQKEIASKIEAIGMHLEKTCPNIAAFTISGVINTFKYKRSNSRSLNKLLRSFKLEHGWGYICNDNLYPTFHMMPFGTALNNPGTSLFASNIIKHLRSVQCNRSRGYNNASHVEKRPEHSNESSSKDKEGQRNSPACIVTAEEDKVSPKDPSHIESKADPEPEDMRFHETGCSGQDHGKSETCSVTHLKQRTREKGKLRKQIKKNRLYVQNVSPLMRGGEFKERPNSRESWSYPRDQSRYNNSSARHSGGARQGRPPQAGKPKPLYRDYSGCYYCGGLDHKKIDCPN